MSKAAIQQRKDASKKAAQARKAEKDAPEVSDSQPVTINRILSENKA